MVNHPISGGGDDAERQPEHPLRSMTFIVRVSENEHGQYSGVVEHARTGRKERFEQVEAIGRVIASLLVSAGRPDGDGRAQ
jgi:hypothetical protein